MISLKEFNELSKQRDRIASKIDKAKGSLETQLERLRKEHSCKSVKEARSKLKQLEKELSEEDKEIEMKLQAFKQNWKDKLEE